MAAYHEHKRYVSDKHACKAALLHALVQARCIGSCVRCCWYVMQARGRGVFDDPWLKLFKRLLIEPIYRLSPFCLLLQDAYC